jgi:hypothetical protein
MLFALALACDTERIELAGDRDANVAADAALEDAGEGDAGTADTGAPDSGALDTGAPDTGAECTCRYAMCRSDPDCVAAHGAGSTCNVRELLCTGALGACASETDCTQGWICTRDPSTSDPCP